ncbi:MAG: hypothetical protein IJM24_03700 [Clostridia bacterium]|nr:hypothetical protein [Clostridia bacterium]MBR7063362.1 hypothetical protein [Clostridia bacterium]
MESFNGIVIEDDQTVEQRIDVRNLQVYGRGVFREDVDADEIEVFGSARFRSFVSCDQLSVPGETVMLDSLLAESVRVDGVLNVSGKFRTEVAVVEGMMNTQGRLHATRLVVRSRGRLEAAGNIKAERIIIDGVAFSGATFRGDNIEITSCEQSEIARVVASDIKVTYKPRGDVPGIKAGEYLLSAYSIETQTAEIEYVAADSLDCDSAVIGPGCRIGELTYRDGLEIDPGAVVERLNKI